MQPQQVQVHSLTTYFEGIARVLTTPVEIFNTQSGAKYSTRAIWDTGATGSVITKDLANALGLVAVSKTRVKGVHGYKDGINVYAIKIVLNNQNISLTIPVTECEKLTDDDSCQFLLGMDIISKGDFALTNSNGQTVMTFSMPSILRFDFVRNYPIKPPSTFSN